MLAAGANRYFAWLQLGNWRHVREIFVLARQKQQNIANRFESRLAQLGCGFGADTFDLIEVSCEIHKFIVLVFRKIAKSIDNFTTLCYINTSFSLKVKPNKRAEGCPFYLEHDSKEES